jgi:hypothetical protein
MTWTAKKESLLDGRKTAQKIFFLVKQSCTGGGMGEKGERVN